MDTGTHRSSRSHAHKCALLGERWPPLLRAPHAHALCVPRMQCARDLAGRRAACIEHAVEKEPISSEHVEVVVLLVVLARVEVGKKAPEVLEVRGVGAKLRQDSREHEVGVAQVAKQEGAHHDPLVVRQLVGFDRVALGLGPPLFILAADDVHDDHLRLLRRHCAIEKARKPACPHEQTRSQGARGSQSSRGEAWECARLGHAWWAGAWARSRQAGAAEEAGGRQLAGAAATRMGQRILFGGSWAVVNVEREARTVNPLEHLPKVRVP